MFDSHICLTSVYLATLDDIQRFPCDFMPDLCLGRRRQVKPFHEHNVCAHGFNRVHTLSRVPDQLMPHSSIELLTAEMQALIF